MSHPASESGSPQNNSATLLKLRERWRVLARNLTSQRDWDNFSLEVFRFHASENEVYRRYIGLRGVKAERVTGISQIPHIPISVFRDHEVGVALPDPPERIFRSSGTTSTKASDRSAHHVDDLSWYEEVAQRGFEREYGPVQEFPLLTLLPGYRERPDSSLIHMARHFKDLQNTEENFMNTEPLASQIASLQRLSDRPTLLLGVTFALLDWVDTLLKDGSADLPFDPARLIVMETGGMKGRRTEWTREEVHERLARALPQAAIHSEYGMTELMSQAYARKEGKFEAPPWLRVTIVEPDDPMVDAPHGRTGRIRLTDLANLHSCPFIDTDDLGRMTPQGQFEVIGRFESADVRGCSLLTV